MQKSGAGRFFIFIFFLTSIIRKKNFFKKSLRKKNEITQTILVDFIIER